MTDPGQSGLTPGDLAAVDQATAHLRAVHGALEANIQWARSVAAGVVDSLAAHPHVDLTIIREIQRALNDRYGPSNGDDHMPDHTATCGECSRDIDHTQGCGFCANRNRVAHQAAEHIAANLTPTHQQWTGIVGLGWERRPPTTVEEIKADLMAGRLWIPWLDDAHVREALAALYGTPVVEDPIR